MSDVRFFDLSIPAPRRLEMMRRAFENHPTKYPHCPEHAKPRTWRDVRAYTHGSWAAAFIAGLNGGRNGDGAIWYTHGGPYFPERFADDVDQYIKHCGWFTDVHQCGTARGIVARLPHGRFLAGYFCSDNDERVYCPELFEDEVDAARMADEHARAFGEMALEDSERYERARELEDKADELCTELREFIRARNVSEFMRDRTREILAELRETRESLADYSQYI